MSKSSNTTRSGRGSTARVNAKLSVSLPNITGSDKQIKWATEIRDKNIENMDKTIESYKQKINPQYAYILDEVRTDVLNNSPSSAREWIDDSTSGKLLSKYNPYTYDLLDSSFKEKLRARLLVEAKKIKNGQ